MTDAQAALTSALDLRFDRRDHLDYGGSHLLAKPGGVEIRIIRNAVFPGEQDTYTPEAPEGAILVLIDDRATLANQLAALPGLTKL